MKPDSVALIVPSLGLTDLDEMLTSLGENRFDEIVVCIDYTGRSYVADPYKLADIPTLKTRFPFVIWCEYHGNGMINGCLNVAYENSTAEWIWITHDDILFPQQIAPHPGYRYDLRIKTTLKKVKTEIRNVKGILIHYYQIPNKLDTRMFATTVDGDYVSCFGIDMSGGGTTGISTILHRSVIESIEKFHKGRGFDLEYATYYDTQIIVDSEINHWINIPMHDAPAILHKVSAAGRFTNNCNNFEPNPKWFNIRENADAWREHVKLSL